MRGLLTAALLLVAAGGLVAYGLWLRRGALRGADWPVVEARILERGVAPGQRHALASPRVRYAYEVAGVRHEGDRFYAHGVVEETRAVVERMVASLPDPLPVKYNPQAPAEAFVRANPSWTYRIALGAGAIAALLGVMRLLTALHGRGRGS